VHRYWKELRIASKARSGYMRSARLNAAHVNIMRTVILLSSMAVAGVIILTIVEVFK